MVFPIAGKSNKSFPATHGSSNIPAHPGGTIHFRSPTKIPYPRVSSHQVRNLPILSQLCQWRSECHLFLYPVADSVRRVTRSLLHNITTRINDGASICAVMRLGLAWITKWPRGLAFNQRTSFCHVAVSILTFMFC